MASIPEGRLLPEKWLGAVAVCDCLSARPLEPDPGYAGVGTGSSENVLFRILAFPF